jgi:methionyl aminopeptidase
VNDEIVHGIPGRRQLRDGDIISVDVGAILDGYHGDSAWTYSVGDISERARSLLRDTEAALYLAVDAARTGNRMGAIGHAVQTFARERRLSVVKDYGGHGIGREMHEEPHVPNVGTPDRGLMLRTGLALAIEPMLTTGGGETRTLRDGWTVVTADGSLAAHFEHTVAVMPEGGRVLTPRLSPVLE